MHLIKLLLIPAGFLLLFSTNVLSKSINTPAPKIQVAIMLDTSSSMDGLIDQTRNQLWQVINEFSTAKQNGVTPILEVALFEYGHSSLPADQGYIRKVNGFTRELDKVSEGLFALHTNGGDEYCGFAIQTAVNQLQWSTAKTNLKMIFIAGNEPFTQGPVDYRQAIKLAKERGITVNTIFAGDHLTGVNSGWQSGAQLAQGNFMSIDANQKVVHIDAPQDKKIAELNNQLNETYVHFGKQGKEKAHRQIQQDNEANKISSGLLSTRAKTKSSSYYDNSSWDLVDAYSSGSLSDESLESIEEITLPEQMQGLSLSEKKEFVEQKTQQRKKIKQEIAELSKARDLYVAKKRKDEENLPEDVSDALTQAIKKQAVEKDFTF